MKIILSSLLIILSLSAFSNEENEQDQEFDQYPTKCFYTPNSGRSKQTAICNKFDKKRRYSVGGVCVYSQTQASWLRGDWQYFADKTSSTGFKTKFVSKIRCDGGVEIARELKIHGPKYWDNDIYVDSKKNPLPPQGDEVYNKDGAIPNTCYRYQDRISGESSGQITCTQDPTQPNFCEMREMNVRLLGDGKNYPFWSKIPGYWWVYYPYGKYTGAKYNPGTYPKFRRYNADVNFISRGDGKYDTVALPAWTNQTPEADRKYYHSNEINYAACAGGVTYKNANLKDIAKKAKEASDASAAADALIVKLRKDITDQEKILADKKKQLLPSPSTTVTALLATARKALDTAKANYESAHIKCQGDISAWKTAKSNLKVIEPHENKNALDKALASAATKILSPTGNCHKVKHATYEYLSSGEMEEYTGFPLLTGPGVLHTARVNAEAALATALANYNNKVKEVEDVKDILYGVDSNRGEPLVNDKGELQLYPGRDYGSLLPNGNDSLPPCTSTQPNTCLGLRLHEAVLDAEAKREAVARIASDPLME